MASVIGGCLPYRHTQTRAQTRPDRAPYRPPQRTLATQSAKLITPRLSSSSAAGAGNRRKCDFRDTRAWGLTKTAGHRTHRCVGASQFLQHVLSDQAPRAAWMRMLRPRAPSACTYTLGILPECRIKQWVDKRNSAWTTRANVRSAFSMRRQAHAHAPSCNLSAFNP